MAFEDAEEQYKRLWEERPEPGRYDRERTEVWASLQQQLPKRRQIPRWIGYAAAAAVLAAVGLFALKQQKPVPATWTSLNNPGAQPRLFHLSDGSSVWLNAHSTLEYQGRNARLTGEAFFSITTDPVHPFVVAAAGLTTRVLGTTFNIDAYPGERSVHVALVSGSVGVQHGDRTLILKPGDVATFSTASQTLVAARLDIDEVDGWTRGKLVLEQVSLKDAIQRITARTGIAIALAPGLARKEYKISGSYDLASVDGTLQAIAFVHRLRVVHQKDRFLLTE